MRFGQLLTSQFILLFGFLTANLLNAQNQPYLNLDYQLKLSEYGGKTYPVVDVSSFHKEAEAINYPGIKTIDAKQIFKPGTVFLGFGLPNVYSARVTDTGVRKFDVKSLHRAESTIAESDGRVQSGILIVPKNISKESIENVAIEANKRVGKTYSTCANGNFQLLKASGFTLASSDPGASYFFPNSLLEAILTEGILFDGKPVDFDIVNTTPYSLKEFIGLIKNATLNTPIRHLKKATVTPEQKKTALENAAQVVEINEKLAAENPSAKPSDNTYIIETSEPSKLGRLARSFWGDHTIFRITLTGEGKPDIATFLPKTLQEFPNENPDFFTKFKKNWLFSPTVVQFIGSNMAPTYSAPKTIDEAQITGLMEASTEEKPNKFNFVLTDSHMIIGKLNAGYKWADWILSKHVLLSNYAKNVRYAGEMWKTADGVIHINNDSGTYKPTLDDMGQALKFAQALFPNLKIVMERAEASVDAPKQEEQEASSICKLEQAIEEQEREKPAVTVEVAK